MKDGIAVGLEDFDIWVDVIVKGGVSVGAKTWVVGFRFVLLGLCVWLTVGGGDSFVGEVFLYLGDFSSFC